MVDALHPPSVPSALPPLGDLAHWVFDLDNTLYPASCSLFPQIDVRMRQFISEALHLPLDEAFALQKHYYHEFGTTLRGLMQMHGIVPDDFLTYVHDIDCGVLTPAPRLAAAIRALPGRKLIYTNGSERHALNVLAHLGLDGDFDGIFDIRAADYVPKPNAASYDMMIRRHGVTPRLAAMFEDIPRNLLPAAQAGMTTVLVEDQDGHSHWSGHEGTNEVAMAHVHHVTDDLAAWLERAVS